MDKRSYQGSTNLIIIIQAEAKLAVLEEQLRASEAKGRTAAAAAGAELAQVRDSGLNKNDTLESEPSYNPNPS